VILDAVLPGCEQALDVGCGTGALTRRLRRLVPHVTGIDRDERSIELARTHPGAAGIDYVLGDFLTTSFEPGSLDLVTSVASLHHMDARGALRRMSDLLRPGGVLAVVGLARCGSPADLAREVPAVIGTRLHHAARFWRRRAAVGWLGVTGRPLATAKIYRTRPSGGSRFPSCGRVRGQAVSPAVGAAASGRG
jgi:2-polyprenyl-3-methyl-5-hydroxy-6-metoxy-1,4-benzoquinol methylase